ncbi:pyrroloquinoline quinone precursor peptide PqqA [Streptomyces vastus]|uniref:Coenzyme PQQ synthesis protein A n=1 Tax=Streptomyces vastus TaxID=285451 RepID=A0ABN3RU63_9ACTN
MNEAAYDTQHTERIIQETSEDMVWETPGHLVVETALEVTAYALSDR